MNEYKAKAMEIIAEWNAKTGAEQQALCRNCVLKAIRGGRKLAHGDELDDAAHSAYLKVLDQLSDVDKLDTTGKAIFKGMTEGRTEREIAHTVNLSNAGVHKRATKIRAQLAALL